VVCASGDLTLELSSSWGWKELDPGLSWMSLCGLGESPTLAGPSVLHLLMEVLVAMAFPGSLAGIGSAQLCRAEAVLCV
jgi:hypothetical protein